MGKRFIGAERHYLLFLGAALFLLAQNLVAESKPDFTPFIKAYGRWSRDAQIAWLCEIVARGGLLTPDCRSYQYQLWKHSIVVDELAIGLSLNSSNIPCYDLSLLLGEKAQQIKNPVPLDRRWRKVPGPRIFHRRITKQVFSCRLSANLALQISTPHFQASPIDTSCPEASVLFESLDKAQLESWGKLDPSKVPTAIREEFQDREKKDLANSGKLINRELELKALGPKQETSKKLRYEGGTPESLKEKFIALLPKLSPDFLALRVDLRGRHPDYYEIGAEWRSALVPSLPPRLRISIFCGTSSYSHKEHLILATNRTNANGATTKINGLPAWTINFKKQTEAVPNHTSQQVAIEVDSETLLLISGSVKLPDAPSPQDLIGTWDLRPLIKFVQELIQNE